MVLTIGTSEAQEHPVFDGKGAQNGRDSFSQLPAENIDTLTGNLLLTFNDLALPGNAGLDLVIQRSFNSKSGGQWTFGLAGVPMKVLNAEGLPPWFTDERRQYPTIVTADGGKHDTTTLDALTERVNVTREFWRYDRLTHEVLLPNGWVAEFERLDAREADPQMNPAGRNVRYLTAVRDAFGNRITVTYTERSYEYVIETIHQELGANQTRDITFSYEGEPLHRVQFMRYGARTWEYRYEPGSAGQSLLNEVVPPEGPSWRYGYTNSELTSVTTPQGGTIEYAYSTHIFSYPEHISPHNGRTSQGVRSSRVISQRTVGGRGNVAGTWLYDYSELLETDKKTVITGPSSVVTTHYALVGQEWAIDWRTTADGSGVLEREERSYELVPYDNWSPAPVSKEPVVKFRTVQWFLPEGESGGVVTRTWSTQYSYRAGDYDQPWLVVESGEYSRTTTRVFEYEIAGYRKPSLKTETVTESGHTSTKEIGYDLTTGFVSSETQDGVGRTYGPDARGNRTSSTDALGHASTSVYKWGVRKDTTSATGVAITREINPDGTVERETQRGQITRFEYDDLSRLRLTTPPKGNAVLRTFDAVDGALVSVTVKRGSASLVTKIDGFGRPVGTVNSKHVETAATYDANGRKTFESLPYTGTVVGDALEYDALGRLTRRQHSDQTVVTSHYEAGAGGFDIRITDENGHATVQHWAAGGDPSQARLVGVRDADGKEWGYSYNVTGALSAVTAPQTPGSPATDIGPRTWVYDANNHLQSESHPESGTTTFSDYDVVGNLKVKTDQAGTRFEYAYDADNRVTKVTATGPAGTQVKTIAYEENSDKRETVAIQGGASVTFHYDEAGRLKERTQVVHGRTLSTLYTYEGDNLDLVKYPSGRAVEYKYDDEGRIDLVRDVSGDDRSKDFEYANTMRYHPSGALTSYTTPNGLTHTVTFDSNRYWPFQIRAGSLLAIDYTNYDGVGNVRQIKTTNGFAAPVIEQFQFDALERLQIMASPDSYGTGRFDYDVHGNRITNTYGSYDYFPGTLRLRSQGSQASAQNFAYDANGNLKTAPNASYAYTPDNMLSRATTIGRDTSYGYDGDQLRVSRTSTDTGTNVASTSLFSYGPAGQLLGEYREGSGGGFSTIREYIYAGSKLLAEVLPPTGGSPTVSVSLALTSADPGGEFLAPATITLTATASTTVGTIQRVEFYNGEQRIGTSVTSPYTVTLSGLGVGTYTFMAKAVNASGQVARDTQTVRVFIVGHPQGITVTPDPAVPGQPAIITVTGTSPCGALQLNYGDGTEAAVLPIVDVPATFTHIWAASGTYTLTITGHGNCRGTVSRQVTVGTPNLLPTVTLTQPTAGVSVPAGTALTLSATAADADGSIAHVEFFAGATLVASVTAAPYTTTWNADTPGAVVIKAIAYDDRGATAQATAAITVSHLSGISVSPGTIQAGQSATVTVTGLSSCGAVQINYDDGTVVTYPLSGLPMSQVHTWTTGGTKTIVAQGQGNCLGSFATTLTVTANAAPTVTLTAPAAGASYVAPATIALTATAQDSDGTIARVDFYAGATLVGTSASAPFSASWSGVAAGTYALTAKAVDNAGATTTSSAVSITVGDLAAVTVVPNPIQQGQTGTVTITGSGTCGAIQVNYGDGTIITYPISGLPLAQTHVWSTAGAKTIVATGQGNCFGTRSTALTVTANTPPVVTLTSPPNGGVKLAGQSITVSATASDSDGTVTLVEFLDGATVIGSDSTAPYAVAWTPAAGSHTLTARATDNGNATTTSAAATITVIHVAAVSVSPASVVQGETATVTVTGSSICGAVQIDYGDGSVVTYPLSGLPFSQTHAWATAGVKTVIATGQASCTGTASGTVTVNVNTPPVVTLTSPANGAVKLAGQSLTVSATASDSDGTVTMVEFLDGATVIGSDSTAPYAVAWTPAAGSHTLTARATDNGNATATSAPATITVIHVAAVSVSPASVLQGVAATVTVTGSSTCGAVQLDYGDGTVVVYPISGLPFSQTHAWATTGVKTVIATGQGSCTGTASGTVTVNVNTAPSVALTSPSNGAVVIVPQSVTLTATASDTDGSIARVEFLNGATIIATVSAAPYTTTWTPGPGAYAITARAVDNGGITATSAVANITVKHVAGLTVSPATVLQGVNATVTVTGSTTCGAVQLDYGDGTVVVYPISGLPFSQTHAWATTGVKTVTATGQGNCTGTASGTVTVATNTAPSVALTSPSNGAVVIVPQSVTLTATASDADGTIARVEFLNGATIIATLTAAPYTTTWNPGPGAYAITARAVDNGGITATAAVANITVKHVAGLTVSPASVLQGVNATVTVTGSTGCGAVQLDYGDGSVVTYPLTGLPFSQTHAWATTGTKTVTATGQGNCTGTASGTVTVNVNTPPSVTLTAPSNGAVYIAPQSVTLTATASDAGGSVARVEFLNGATIIGTVNSAPYTMSWTPGTGTYAVSARAVDDGGFATTSGAVNITVKHVAGVAVSPGSVVQGVNATVTVTGSPACGAVQIDYGDGSVVTYPLSGLPISQTHAWATPGTKTVTATGQGNCVGSASGTVNVTVNTPPSVSLTSPANGAAFVVGQSVTLTASASDSDGTINRVEFLNGGAVIGTATSAPYTTTWAPAAGTYLLSARAVDNGNASSTSATASITLTHVTGVSVSPGSVVPGQAATITVTGSASCGAVQINYGDGNAITYALSGLPTSQSYTWTSAGTRTVTATGQGNCVGTATTSVAVVTNSPPSVSLTAPGSGSIYTTGTALTISANASDAHGVSRVEFYAGGALIGTDYSAPYAVGWSAASGAVSVWARAFDVYGAYADSAGSAVIGHDIDPRMALDSPLPNSVTGQPLMIGGWAVDLGAPSGSGVDAIHVYANPSGGGSIFLGAAPYGSARPDLAAVCGEQFRYSGFTMSASGLAPGTYTIVVYAHSTVTGIWNARSATITIPTPNVLIGIDTPSEGQSVGSSFYIGGWAIDAAHPTESGVSGLHVYAYPASGAAPIFLGGPQTGGWRPDVGNAFGARFSPSGWGLSVSGLAPGWYTLVFYPWSTVTQSFRFEAAITRNVYVAY